MVNILAYADDLVLLAPSLRALQLLLDKLHSIANHLGTTQNGAVMWLLISFQTVA